MIFDFCFEIDLINLNPDQTLNRSNPSHITMIKIDKFIGKEQVSIWVNGNEYLLATCVAPTSTASLNDVYNSKKGGQGRASDEDEGPTKMQKQ